MQVWNRYTMPKDITATYIGRGTPWGNPFKVGDEYTQEQAADKYRRMLARMLAARNKQYVQAVLDLAGIEHICCSCKPKACHGDCFAEIWSLIREKGIKPLEGIREWVKLNGYGFGPATDGKDHINIYSKSKTALGKRLTNLSGLNFVIPWHGEFDSMEGYWYWLKTGRIHENLKYMNGFEAKKFAKDLPAVHDPLFKDHIRYALWKRFSFHPSVKEAFIKSSLPFKHYYCYGDDDRTVVYPPFDWITDELTLLRDIWQGKKTACIIAGSRDITDPDIVKQAIDESGFNIDVDISGTANGVDTIGEQWALDNNVPIRRFHPQWDHFGKKAGILRNNDMGEFCTHGIVLIKNNSVGSTQMAKRLQALNKPVYIKVV